MADEVEGYAPRYDLIREHIADATWTVIKRQTGDPLALAARLCIDVEDAEYLLHLLSEAEIVGRAGPAGVREVLVPDSPLPLEVAMRQAYAARSVALRFAAWLALFPGNG